MKQVSDAFSAMGIFSAAFGMDQVSFGTLTGSMPLNAATSLDLVELYNAAMCGISMLSKEEKGHTAEFLLAHPVSRFQVLSGKLAALGLQILILNLAVLSLSLFSISAVGESIPWKEFSCFIWPIPFCRSRLLPSVSEFPPFCGEEAWGLGLGLAILFYFFNLIANISESAEFLKYISPYGYAEGTDIVTSLSLDRMLVLLGMLYGIIGIAAGYIKYGRKDILQ